MSTQSKCERMGGGRSSSDGVLFFGLVCTPDFSFNLSVYFFLYLYSPFSFFVHPVPAAAAALTYFSCVSWLSAKIWRWCCLPPQALYPPVRLKHGRRLISLLSYFLFLYLHAILALASRLYLYMVVFLVSPIDVGGGSACVYVEGREEGVATVGGGQRSSVI